MDYHVIAQAQPGESIRDAAAHAVQVAERNSSIVALTHNGAEVLVDPNDTADDVLTAWDVLRSQAIRRATLA